MASVFSFESGITIGSFNEDIETGVTLPKKRKWERIEFYFRKHLAIVMMAAVICGAIVGFLCRLRSARYTKREAMYASYLGYLYMHLLQCTTFPLFTSSVLTAFGNLDWKSSGKIVIRTFGFFLLALLLGGSVGAAVTFSFRPGELVAPLPKKEPKYVDSVTIWHYALDIIRNLIPVNIVEACMFMYKTEIKPVKPILQTETSPVLEAVEEPVRGTNYLGLIVVASVLGISISYLGASAKLLLALAEAANKLCIDLTLVLLYLSPPGMGCLAFSQVLIVEDFRKMFQTMGLAIAAVLFGLAIHVFIALPALHYFMTRKNIFKLYLSVFPAIATCWATASSIATIPVTITALEKRANVSRFVARFIVPLGANLNQSGSAVYEFILACFLAQNRGLSVSTGQYGFAWFVSMVGTLTAPGIPGGNTYGLHMVTSILGVTGEDFEWISMVDPFMDRFCTAVNVLGDCIAAAYLEDKSKNEVRKAKRSIEMGDNIRGNVQESLPSYSTAA